MKPASDPYGLDGRRRAVFSHFERYRKLAAAGRQEEAIEQLRVATRLANESVEHTIEVAHTILSRIEDLCRTDGVDEEEKPERECDPPGRPLDE